MLVPRDRIKNQFCIEMGNTSNVDKTLEIMTYQKIEHELLDSNSSFSLDNYNYIVCDEFHYFLNDAEFNNYTDLSFNIILNSRSTKILMSATGNIALDYIKRLTDKKIKLYDFGNNINISELNFYNKKDTLYYLAREIINNNEKGILFIKSAEKAYELYRTYKNNAIFCCGRSSEYYRYVDSDIIESLLKNEKFDTNLLITTTVLDCGITIKDKNLKHMVIDNIFDIDTIIQCLGRKRKIDEFDNNLFVYISNFSNKQLAGIKTQIQKKTNKALYFKSYGLREYLLKYPRQQDTEMIIYDVPIEDNDKCTKRLNELMLEKRMNKINVIETMLDYNIYGRNGFMRYIRDNLYIDNYFILEEEDIKNELEYYLEEHLGETMLSLKDRNELIEKINLTDNRGKLLKKISSLNSCLQEIGSDYRIIELNKITKTIDGKKKQYKTPWQIVRLVSE